MKVKLEKYRLAHFPVFCFGLLDLQALKFAGIFKRRFLFNFFGATTNEFFKFSILVDGRIVGGLDIVKISNETFNIGIIIFKKYRNRGIATIAVRKAFVIAKKLGAKKVSGTNIKENFYSIKLVKKLGYKKIKDFDKGFIWEKRLK